MDSKSRLMSLLLVGFLLLALASGQLIGPFQACEMRCQEEMKAFHDVLSSIKVSDVCHNYCLKHAFDPNATFPTFNPPVTAAQ